MARNLRGLDIRLDADEWLSKLNSLSQSLDKTNKWSSNVAVINFGARVYSEIDYSYYVNKLKSFRGFVRIFLGNRSIISQHFIDDLLQAVETDENSGVQLYLFEGCGRFARIVEHVHRRVKGRLDIIIPGRMFNLDCDGVLTVLQPPCESDLQAISVCMRTLRNHPPNFEKCILFSMNILFPPWPTDDQMYRGVQTMRSMLTFPHPTHLIGVDLDLALGSVRLAMHRSHSEFTWRHDPFRFVETTAAVWTTSRALLNRKDSEDGWSKKFKRTLQIDKNGDSIRPLMLQILGVGAAKYKGSKEDLNDYIELVESAPFEVEFQSRFEHMLTNMRYNIKGELVNDPSSCKKLQRIESVTLRRQMSVGEMIRILMDESISCASKEYVMRCALQTSPHSLIENRIFSDAIFSDGTKVSPKSRADIDKIAIDYYDYDISQFQALTGSHAERVKLVSEETLGYFKLV